MPGTERQVGGAAPTPRLTANAGSAGHTAEPVQFFNSETRFPPRHDLPARLTNFVGRTLELAELTQLLAAPDCRLITIIGPGGIGKTRLAIEVADAVREMFADGIAFVPFQALGAAEPIPPAIANAVGCVLSGQGDEGEQVKRCLRQLQMLLVVDNFEHLLVHAPWLGELLAESPGLRVLVTSREALNLREEWRYPLAGLSLPADDIDIPGMSEAVVLVVDRARQRRPEFSFETERDAVVQLCHITEGMPLALELAAAWVTTLSCAEIAAEIERNIAFLATDLRNVPARHRSMLAAFDHSWALLTDDERRAFRRLAAFHGGFSRDASEQIAEATLPMLSSLVGKSLVRRNSNGRFQLHELLRQYAADHLRAHPDDEKRTVLAHREFYLSFVETRFKAIIGGAQREAVVEIAAELDNVRAAWRGAVAAGDAEALGRVSHTLTVFFDFRARYREGMALLEEGLSALRAATPTPEIDRTTTDMLVDAVRLNHRLAHLPAMRATLAEAEARYTSRASPPPHGHMTDPKLWRALLTLIDGDYAEAARLSADVIARNTADERPGNLPCAWWVRAAAALWQEDLNSAGEYARQCSVSALTVGDRWGLAYCHNMQGHIATARREYVLAREHYSASFAIREEFEDPEGMCTGLTHLAKIAALQGEQHEAERLYLNSLAIARDIGDQITTANALNGLGTMACSSGDFAAAGRYFAEGLHLMADAQMVRLQLTFLTSAGEWFLATGQPADAATPLALALEHPGSDHDTRIRAERLLADVKEALSRQAGDATTERVHSTDPAVLAAKLIPLLLTSSSVPQLEQAMPESPSSTVTGPFAEPLTERELSVLRLIAVGLSNRQIADELFLSVNTVRSYSQQIYGKLGVGSRTQAVARARELGILA
jgi:predicted ATPase/DNA-binding CsgD family transcriptional regulator